MDKFRASFSSALTAIGVGVVAVLPMVALCVSMLVVDAFTPDKKVWSGVIDVQQRAHNEFGHYLDGDALAASRFGPLPDGVTVTTNAAGTCFVASATNAAGTWLMDSRTHTWELETEPRSHWCVPG